MPLRDHFRPPIWNRSSWEGFHGGWPMTIVQRLLPQLPAEFVAEPRVHLGTYYEIDVCAFDEEHGERSAFPSEAGGVATAVATATSKRALPQPTFAADAQWLDQYNYEVLIYDQSRARQLVAAVELVSPANKDRPKSRSAFATKCAALLQQRVCVSIVDLVTIRNFNLYADVLALAECADPALAPKPPAVYAATCRALDVRPTPRLESWAYPLAIGQPLPTLPLWLSEDEYITLELEASYEDTCRVLRIA